MVKKMVATSVVSAFLLLSGCGSSDAESQLEIQQMLDNGDYSGVIAKLATSADTVEEYVTLGSAYMGRAGLSLTNIISAISANNNTNDSFSSFVSSISSKSSATAMSDLAKANEQYKKVVGNKCSDVNATLSDAQKDICLYIGLSSTSQAAVTIDLLAGDINAFGSDSLGADDKLVASTCAMNYAYNGNYDALSCSLTQGGTTITFSDTNRTYTPLTVSVNAVSYDYLITDANTTALTKGYCTLDSFTTRVNDNNGSLYACPLNDNANEAEISSITVLTQVLNEGIASTGMVASVETQSDVNEFKCNVLGGNYNGNSCDIDITQMISEQAVINYLNNQNK